MSIREKVQYAYSLLGVGYKKRAAEIHGVSDRHFKGDIVDGNLKNDDTYYSALQAIKQASLEEEESVKKRTEEIKGIKVYESA